MTFPTSRTSLGKTTGLETAALAETCLLKALKAPWLRQCSPTGGCGWVEASMGPRMAVAESSLAGSCAQALQE